MAITPALLGPLCRLLLVAGFETTVNAIGNGVRALLATPVQWQLLVDDPDLAPAVFEEVLRYDPPVQLTARTPRRTLSTSPGHLVSITWRSPAASTTVSVHR